MKNHNIYMVCFCIALAVTDKISYGQASPDEIFDRVMVASKMRFKTGMGAYLVRQYDSKKGNTEVIKEQLAGVEKSLRESIEHQKNASKQLGVNADIAKLESDAKRTLESMRTGLMAEGLTTVAEFFYIDGSKFRLERVTGLLNDIPLDQLRDRIVAGDLKLDQRNAVQVWDGELTAEYVETEKGVLKPMLTELKPATPAFLTFGREMVEDVRKLAQNSKMGLSFERAPTDLHPDRLVLRVGEPESVSALVEFGILPDKGYVIESGMTKMYGAIMSYEKMGDWYEVEPGVWVPRSLVRENYTLNDKGVRSLALKMEVQSFQDPKVNIPIPQELLDDIKKPEFVALRKGFNGKPFSFHPSQTPSPKPVAPNRTAKVFFIGMAGIVLVSLFVFRLRSSRK